MKNIYIVTWTHPFHVVEHVAEMIAVGLRQNGNNVKLINSNNLKNELSRIQSESIDLIIGMNPQALLFSLDGKFLHELIDTRYAILFLDNPIYLRNQFNFLIEKNLPLDTIFMCVDFEQKNQMRSYLNKRYESNFTVLFSPWASNPLFGFPSTPSKKIIDVSVFATLDQQLSGSFLKNDDYSEKLSIEVCANAKVDYTHFNDFVIESAKSNFSIDVIQYIEKSLGIEYPDFNPQLLNLATEIDSYLKRYRRFHITKNLVNSAINNNYKIALFGTGWDKLGDLPQNIKIYGPTAYDQQFKIFQHSKTVLNTDPNWVGGAHDRVFNAIASHCSVLTNENIYTRSVFTDKHDLYMYKNAQEVEDLTEKVIANYEKISINAFNEFINNHTWKHRLNSLCQLI